ncbi:hypothetical protein [Candidatus Poriferisodalis sp.]|uniref:hypothetical protein n=1 Tax=Candidatus Poriferisodalis sp. TaxID=3101277 RepID=UPI003D0FC531
MAAAVLLAAAACAASGADESGTGQIATLAETATSGASSSDSQSQTATTEDAEAPPEEMTIEEARLEFAACMRETYPQWPDPSPEGGFGGREALEELSIDPQDGEFPDVLDECRSVLQGVVGVTALSPEEQAERQDTVLAVFACVREQPGFEGVPDPNFDAGAGRGFGMRELFGSGEIDPQAFASAIQQCATDQGLRGQPGPGGGLFGGRRGGNGG